MNRRHSCLAFAALLLASAACAEDRVIATLADFEQDDAGPWPPLVIWRWSDAEKTKADSFTLREVCGETPYGRQCLRVRVSGTYPWPKGNPHLMTVSKAYFPPEADAIRMRVKVLGGRLSLTIGGPTAYYGNSDAFARPAILSEERAGAWTTVEFSLNHRLFRNYRRASYSRAAPRIYYTRWAQEPTFLYALPGSQGEVLIDDIELVARGEGRPWPQIAPGDVTVLSTIATFETSNDLSRAFTLLMSDGQVGEFARSWTHNPPPRYPPPRLALVDEGQTGKPSLSITATFLEEILSAGVKTTSDPQANALQLSVNIDTSGPASALAGYGPCLPLDVVVIVAPTNVPFAWERFGASAELRKGPGTGFDYDLSYRTVRDLGDASFAFYQARRFPSPGTWTSLVIPFADFTCIYGQGDYADRLEQHMPLVGADVIAVSLLAPWPRSGRAETTILVDELTYVRVRGTDQELRSFWQVPDIGGVYLWEDSVGRYGNNRYMLPVGEVGPVAE